MTHRMLNKTQPAYWLCALILLGMMGNSSKPVFAITAFTPQAQPVAYLGQEVVTNGTLTSGNETLFRTEYEKEFWSGNMYAYPIDANGNLNTVAERWSGGTAVHIEAQNFSTGRFIGTMKDDGTKIPFLSASLSVTQQGTLAATVNSVAYTSTQIVNFLRGDHSNESATTLRQRKAPQGSSSTPTVLGDIIHSKPFYLADATNPTIFVGANDGMLHAIKATDGTERWAYIPSMLLSKMKSLAANPYTHDYYVDGQITVGNATIGGVTTRILVGSLGAGGKGLYALNIDGSTGLTASTDQQAANKALWEITPTKVNYATPQNNDGTANASAYSNLGYTYGTPQIKLVNVGTAASPVPLRAVIIGNGYNNGGDYQSYLFIVNAENGRLVRAIKADNTATNTTGTAATNGTAASPNGLSNILAFDSNADGYVDRVYAGDLNGTMWKFDLSSATANLAGATASVLHVTSPAQPITATPAAILHPSGSGYMVNFATGGIFTGTQPTTGTGATGDLSDTATFYTYGIWDGAPAGNTTLTQPVLTERCYNSSGIPSTLPCSAAETRVRRVTSAPPSWASGGDKGWKVALPIGGERVVGEGSFISSSRYYFSTYNPTISYNVPGTTTWVWGENWQMALESFTGGSTDPFMDLNGNGTVTIEDRIRYTATDTEVVAATKVAGDPITVPNVDGIEVGKWVARGVQSQPTLVKLTSLFTTLFNTNPDVTFPPPAATGSGVSGGHFDEDIYFGAVTNSAQATATITVSSTGSSAPATLGGIQVDGETIVPALTVTDITNGTATSTNATTINSKVTGGVYTATKSGSTITIKAPSGASYNGKTLTILAGTSSVSPGTAPANGTLVITAVAKNQSIRLRCNSVYIGKSSSWTSSNDNTASTRLNALFGDINGTTVNGYTMTCTKNPNTTSPTSLTCTVSAPAGVSACSGGFSVDSDITTSTNTGPSGGTASVTNWSDLAPALSTTTFSGGADGGTSGDTCTSGCQYDTHVHQYDDKYDVTGVNMLNASTTSFNLSRAIPSTSQNFKVIMHNQYLNPAVKIHIGDASYLPNVDFGYTSIKNYTTSATLDLATLPTYNRNPASAGDGLTTGAKYIGSLAVNMPIDALTAKNWWGNGDVRVGLIPTTPYCVWDAAGSTDGNMYQPVLAPANDATLGYPLDGPGTLGYSGSTTPATATGVRHGGALTIQIIRDTTPNSALELNDHLGRAEYGWRVKSALFSTYVLAEYNTYWHHPNGKCFHTSGWTKTPGADTGSSTASAPAAGSTDPKIGSLSGSGGTVSSVVTTGDTTTITYVDGSRDIIQKITNANGTVTTITIHFPAGINGTIANIINADSSVSTTITHADGTTATGSAAAGGSVTLSNGVIVTNATTANTSGSSGSGGLLNQNAIGYRRISWKELIRN
ncbi:MAG: PilC/PilY family type IV pilus protein [Gallionella sp.]|nr:PilC/PilY family type IV pilus protein [Gallionella sp.]